MKPSHILNLSSVITKSFTITAAALLLAQSARAATIYWDGTGTSWNAVGSWSTSSSADTPDPAAVPVAADAAIFNISTVSGAQTVNLNGNQAITSLSFTATATNGATLLGGSGDSVLSLGANGIGMSAGTGAATIGSSTAGQAVTLGITGGASSFPNYQNWNNNSSSLLTIHNGVSITAGGARTLGFVGSGTGGILVNGAISNGASTLTLVINNANATHTLTGANTYTGTTTVTAGSLVLSGAAGAITGGGTVSLSGNMIVDDRGAGGANANRLGAGAITLGTKSAFSYLGSDQAATNSTESIGTLALGSGVSRATVSYNGTNTATLTAGSITRTASSGGIALVNGTGLGRDDTSISSVGRMIVTSAPSTVGTTAGASTGIDAGVQNTRIVPFLLGEATAGSGGLGTATGVANTFLTYNASTGLRPLNLADEFTDNAIASGDNTYVTTTATASSTDAINSLIINGGSLLIDDGVTLTNTSGALLFSGSGSILPSSSTGDFSLGSVEGIISLNSDVTGTIGSTISGTSGVSIHSAGINPATLVLDGANTYSGTTRIGSRVNVVVGNNSAFGTSVIAPAGGTITGDGQPRTLANRFSISGSQTIGGSSDLTLGAPVSGPAVSRESNTNAMMVLTNTGTTSVTGQYSLFNSATGAYNNNGAGVRFGSSANLVISGPITDNNAGNVASGSDFDLIFTGAAANVSLVPTAANNAFGAANVMMVTSSGHYNTITVGGPGGAGDTITPFGAAGIASNSANLVAFFKADKDGQILNNTIQTQASVNAGNGFGFVGENDLTLSGNYSIQASSSFINLATGTWTFGGNVSAATFTMALLGSGDTVFNAASTITGTTGSLSKTGSGTLTLAGTYSLTGNTTLAGGTVVLDYSAGSAGGGTNRLTQRNAVASSAAALGLTGVNLQLSGGSFAQTLGTPTSGTNGTTVNAGQSRISQAGGGSSTIDLGAITRTENSAALVDFAAAGIATTSSGNTSGILGKGWATVAGANWAVGGGAISALASYDSFAVPGTDKNILQTGSDSIAANTVNTLKIATTTSGQSLTLSGQLILSGNGVLFTGADAYSITGSSIRSNTSTTGDLIVHQNGAGVLSIDSDIVNGTGASSLTKSGSGTLVLNGTNTYTGTTSVRGGTLQVASSANLGSGSITLDAGTLRVTNAFDTTRALALGVNGGTVQLDSGTMTLSGVLSGASYGALNKTGVGTLILSGNNSYGGATNISAGTLRLGSATGLGASSSSSNRSNSPVNVVGGNLDIDGFNAAIGNFNLISGNVTDTAGTGSLAAYSFNLQSGTVGAALADVVISGSVSNSINVTKTTSGTVTLTGANTYTGNTNINAGTLHIIGSTAASAVTVNAAGTLGGTGTVGGSVTGSGTIAPGASVGTLTTGAVTFTGTLAIEVNGATGDKLLSTGAVDLTGATLTVTQLGTFVGPYVIAEGTSLTGTMTVPPGYAVDVSNGTQAILTQTGAPANYAGWASANGVTGGVNGDSDNDGIANGVEYGLNTNLAGSSGAPGTYSGNLLSFNKRAATSGNADLSYRIEVSTDLGISVPWADVGAYVQNDGSVISATIPNGPAKNFARLRVIVNP